MLNAQQMRSLPQCFTMIVDPRRSKGRRHRLPVVLAIAAAATLCGMRGYKAISDWADALGQKARERFGCRREDGHYVVPSEFCFERRSQFKFTLYSCTLFQCYSRFKS